MANSALSHLSVLQSIASLISTGAKRNLKRTVPCAETAMNASHRTVRQEFVPHLQTPSKTLSTPSLRLTRATNAAAGARVLSLKTISITTRW
jgi:hypothetical protein